MRKLREGALLIDHRNSPGLLGHDGSIEERMTLTCAHCQYLVVLNPNRVRERPWCYSCDEYICDGCAYKVSTLNEPCCNINKQIDEVAETIIQGGIIHG
jgi:hypothetical protein